MSTSQRQFILRVAAVVAATLAYLLLFALVYHQVGTGVSALTVLPIALAGYLFGMQGGLLLGLFAAPLNMLAYAIAHEAPLIVVSPASYLVAEAAGVALGVVVGAVRDMGFTLRREMQARTEAEAKRREIDTLLREAQAARMAALGLLAGGVAHEVNNPMTYLLNNLAYVRDTLHSTDDARLLARRADLLEAAREAMQGGLRIREVVARLTAFARLDLPERTPVVISRAVQGALVACAHEMFPELQVEHADSNVPAVLGNEVLLTQLFYQLLLNAIQALRERQGAQPRISIAAACEGERVRIEVRDSGPGVPVEHRAHMFEPFYTTRQDQGASGLGLAIAHSIAQSLGGELRLVDGAGPGACFTVWLQSAPGHAAQKA